MAIELEIRAAVDDAVKGIAQVNTRLGDLEGATKKAAESTKQSNLQFTELRSTLALAGGALKTLKGVYDEIIGPTVAYAKQTRDLARNIGATAEESSRLIAVANNLEISFGTLNTALTAAIRKGVDPTVEGIARLADEYNAIQSPIERTKFLLDNFGRSGAELGPLMEIGAAGIREMGQEVERAGLVMSGDAVQAAREYEIAMNDLNDSFMSAMIGLANHLLPAITEFINRGTRQREFVRGLLEEQYGLNNALDTGQRSVQAYGDRWTGLAGAFAAAGQAMEQANTPIIRQKSLIAELRGEAEGLASALDAAKAASQGWAETAGADLERALEAAGVKGEDLRTALGVVDEKLGTGRQVAFDYKTTIEGIAQEFAKTGDIAAFGEAIAGLQEDFDTAAGAAKNIEDRLKEIKRQLAILTNNPWRINIEATYPSLPGGFTPPAGTPAGPRQGGGLVAGGRAYTVGERGPEGFVAPGGGGLIVNNHNTFNTPIDVAAWTMQFARQVREYRQ
jgi:ABC-type transporter Mla subunit MlaD